ncbi:Holliday junction branch migration protein RuvA [Brevibacterium album]|uniref:Holliday junction branch migration protein RuvA n=1 Tax=Brevibacterium album TaxID=417948 RepID=UPI00041ECD27|nr:Holliday junction branch migration protein RuvA [Brevibacterium album]
MIAYLAGTVRSPRADSAVIVTAGVGRQVFLPPALAAELSEGREVELHTELVVREDSLTLFGFDSADARAVFQTLLTVSGVGPKLALAVLGVLGADGLRQAVGTEDQAALTTVPGIGKKGAARMLLELAGKLPAGAADLPLTAGAPVMRQAADEVVDALVGLGWKQAEAIDAVARARERAPEAPVPALLRDALKILGGRL